MFLVNLDALAGTSVIEFVSELATTPVVLTVPDAGDEHGVRSYLEDGVTGVLDRRAEPSVVIQGLRSAAVGRCFVGTAGPCDDDQAGNRSGETPGEPQDEAYARDGAGTARVTVTGRDEIVQPAGRGRDLHPLAAEVFGAPLTDASASAA